MNQIFQMMNLSTREVTTPFHTISNCWSWALKPHNLNVDSNVLTIMSCRASNKNRQNIPLKMCHKYHINL